jgi:hypothetical protein
MELFAVGLFIYCLFFGLIYYYCDESKNNEINQPQKKVYGDIYG